jgi:hypothetical protein
MSDEEKSFSDFDTWTSESEAVMGMRWMLQLPVLEQDQTSLVF